MSNRVILKKGREESLLRRHPWIFSGAIAMLPPCSPGELLPVYSASGTFLAQAYFHPTSSIAGRVLAFEEGDIRAILKQKIAQAVALRRFLFSGTKTNAYRLINAEGDGLPGCIVDMYDDLLVLQVNTQGIEKLKPQLVDLLVAELSPRLIYEKSFSPARLQEGLCACERVLYGKGPEEIEIIENGIKFFVAPRTGQKTGFFLDQREMRSSIVPYAAGRRVLNAFAYTGGFSLYALQGGAEQVDSVEASAAACSMAAKNTILNRWEEGRHRILQEEVFSFLNRSFLDYGLVILDPPAFAKKKSDVAAACRGYVELNALALKKMPRSSILLSCSCSSHIDESLFQNLLFQAALAAKREVRIIGRHRQAADHPISLYHPEGSYLKSLLLYVE